MNAQVKAELMLVVAKWHKGLAEEYDKRGIRFEEARVEAEHERVHCGIPQEEYLRRNAEVLKHYYEFKL